MNWSEADKLEGWEWGSTTHRWASSLISQDSAARDRKLIKFPTGISDVARKLCVTGWTGALAAAKRISRVIWCDVAVINREVFSKRNWGCSLKTLRDQRLNYDMRWVLRFSWKHLEFCSFSVPWHSEQPGNSPLFPSLTNNFFFSNKCYLYLVSI